MFVWDPKEAVPYLVAPENINRCKFKVPRDARICASSVVEYVPQYDEYLRPRTFTLADRLAPVSTAVPADAAQDAESGYTPSFAGEDIARMAEVADAEADSPSKPAAASSSSHDDVKPEGAAPSAPPHPQCDKLLVELGDDVPFKDDFLKKKATSLKHLLTHYPKNPFCPLCHITKDTAMRVSHIKDGKSDDGIDPPKQPFAQLAADDVILAKGSEHFGTGIGGVKTHHVIRDLYSGAYPMSKRDVEAHTKNFRHYVGLRAGELATRTIIKVHEAQELEQAAHQVGFLPETSLPKRWSHNSMLERDVREEKECCRVVHLQSGLPYEYHTYSYPYACLSMSCDRPSLVDPEKTQWEAITKEKFNGIRLCFGQLVYYRRSIPQKGPLNPTWLLTCFLDGVLILVLGIVMLAESFNIKSIEPEVRLV